MLFRISPPLSAMRSIQVHEIGHNNFLDHAGRNVDWGFDE